MLIEYCYEGEACKLGAPLPDGSVEETSEKDGTVCPCLSTLTSAALGPNLPHSHYFPKN